MIKAKKIITLTFIFLLLINACKRSFRDNDRSTASSSSQVFSEFLLNHLFMSIYDIANYNSAFVSKPKTVLEWLPSCFTDSVDTLQSPMILSLNFSTGCKVKSYVYKGTINMSFYGKFDQQNSKIIVNFDNFYFNDWKIEGILTIRNTGKNSLSNQTYQLIFSQAKFISSTKKIEWNNKYNFELVTGAQTTNLSDDIFHITGTASGRSFNANQFDSEIKSFLQFSPSCEWISSGIEQLLPQNLGARKIDYGNACDNSFSVNLYGESIELNIDNP